ncbi:unnamed protein product (macronuclear) [Paramecium tetraurelia]|uniref:Shugoshin C-terminal domain-containing protein n=1 Tax=Paramecium tetraurelia TaxID=5888 RepID=A0DR05_PARTE|nr:uncharacterized protein GSPATT00002873001 [Paramecium tetraurelia]CAK85472.1 unnamed protein product [Paramecium tetraurelia]|eukprot:XP_001452869.1 hypothetical protein (macronuclear) [Paramecium tetraurelia strain d4-2]
MGNNCSYKQQTSDKTQFDYLDLKSNLKAMSKPKSDSLISTSQLTQMEIPNAMLQSPTKPFIPKQNEIRSLVRVPSEESLFLQQFNSEKVNEQENNSIYQQSKQSKPLMVLKSSLKRKTKQNQAQSPNFQSPSPQVQQQIKCRSHSPYYQSSKVEIKTKKSMEFTKKGNQQQDLKPKRKYSDAPIQKERSQVMRRKISDICDDHNYIIGVENYSPTKLRTYTPTSILKRKDSDIETNSPMKKQVRFKEQGLNRKLHYN